MPLFVRDLNHLGKSSDCLAQPIAWVIPADLASPVAQPPLAPPPVSPPLTSVSFLRHVELLTAPRTYCTLPLLCTCSSLGRNVSPRTHPCPSFIWWIPAFFSLEGSPYLPGLATVPLLVFPVHPTTPRGACKPLDVAPTRLGASGGLSLRHLILDPQHEPSAQCIVGVQRVLASECYGKSKAPGGEWWAHICFSVVFPVLCPALLSLSRKLTSRKSDPGSKKGELPLF